MPGEIEAFEAALAAARNGGDYRALFRGKKLGFKIKEALKSCKEIKDSGENVIKTCKESSIPPGSARPASSSTSAESEPGIVDKIRELAELLTSSIRTFGSAFYAALKEKFLALVEAFSKLREALTEALKPLLAAMQQPLAWIIDLLFDVIPSAFASFVSSLVAALVPFIGQIKAAGEMLVSVGKFVKQWIERNRLIQAARRLDPENKFAQEARVACLAMINAEVASAGADAVMSTAHCAVSVTGLVFTGNVAGVVTGIASAIAKLCIQIASMAKDCWQMWKGNEELRFLSDHPSELHPARLFNASTLLGAYYVGSATQSSLIVHSGLDNPRAVRYSSEIWRTKYAQEATALSPFRAKAQQLVHASRLVMSATAATVISDRDLVAAIGRLEHVETRTTDPLAAIREVHAAIGRVNDQIMSRTYITLAGLKKTSTEPGPVMLTVEQWKTYSSIVGFRTDLTKETDKGLQQYKDGAEPMLSRYASGGKRGFKDMATAFDDIEQRLELLKNTLGGAVERWLTAKADADKSKRAGFVRDLDRLVRAERNALFAYRARLAPIHERAWDLGMYR